MVKSYNVIGAGKPLLSLHLCTNIKQGKNQLAVHEKTFPEIRE